MSRRATWILLLLALGLVLVGTPGTEAAYVRMSPGFEQDIAARTYHIEPAELLGLMHNNRIALAILDVRGEADFNLFHLRDARRMKPQPLKAPDLPTLPPLTVSVVVSNDEALANEAWMRLRVLGVKNAYVLAGGMNGWLDVYRVEKFGREGPQRSGTKGDGTLRHLFEAALGARVPAAAPPAPRPMKEGEKKPYES